MVAPVAAGGLGFADARRGVDLRPLHRQRLGRGDPRRLVADRFLGQYRSGARRRHHHRARPLHAGLPGAAVLLRGPGADRRSAPGLLKPNVSTLVGSLYEQGDRAPRRRLLDLLHGDQPRRVHRAADLRLPRAARQLALGFARGRRRHGARPRPVRARPQAHLQPGLERLAADERAPRRRADAAAATEPLAFTRDEWKRIGAIVDLLRLRDRSSGARYEQAGSTLNLFADRYTRLELLGFDVPLVLVPVGAAALRDPARAGLRVALDAARPARAVEPGEVRARPAASWASRSCVLVPGGAMAQSGEGVRVSPLWLIVAYFISELGELCLSPVGLSAGDQARRRRASSA